MTQDIARDTNRGHTVAAVCNSFEQSKVENGFLFHAGLWIQGGDAHDAGFAEHGLRARSARTEVQNRSNLNCRELFENPSFRPDGLKLYPTLVIRGTGLYELWKKGDYRNYPPK